MRQTSAKWITAGYVLSLLMLGCIGVVSYFSFLRLIEEKQWVNHTYQVLGELGAVVESELAAGQGRKDYFLKSDRQYQQVYAVQRQQIFDRVNRLRVLTRDNPVQQQHLTRLEQLLTQQDVLQSKVIQPSSRSAGAGLAVNSANLRLLQQNIESLLVTMKAEEQRLLQHRTNQTDLMIRRVSWIAALGYGFGIALLLWMFWLLLRQFRLTQRLAEEQLQLEQKASQTKVATVLESITDAFVAFDSEFRYTFVNRRAGELFKLEPEELIGQRIWDKFPELKESPLYRAFHRAIAQREVIQYEEFFLPLNCWLENRIYPGSEGLSVFIRDVTAKKQASLALQESERRYMRLIESLPVAVFETDAQGNNLFHSFLWQQLTGLTLEECRGEGWVKALHPDDQEQIAQRWQAAAIAGVPFQSEHRLLHPDGSVVWVYAQAVAARDEAGEIISYIGSLTDITERKRAEAELQRIKEALEETVQERTQELQTLNRELLRSNRELEQFAYIASHDLQEPLRAVTGYTQLLVQSFETQTPNRGTVEEYSQYIVDGALRMRQLIQDLLTYSRVSRSQELEWVDCNQVVQGAIANLQGVIADSNAQITCAKLPHVHGSTGQLTQLFQNLLGNAIKFQKEHRPQISIGVELEPDQQKWKFWVQDNGIGIKSQYLERIFEVFKRLHTRREFPGTGIGLAICKKIVEQHGGCIWATSEPGVGTTFWFTLPNTYEPSPEAD